MISDNKTWVTLIEGLAEATKSGRLRWAEKDFKSAHSFEEALGSAFAGRQKVFSAQTRQTAYEISATDHFTSAPYQLNVWQMDGLKQLPLGTVRSSSHIDPEGQKVNKALEKLFVTVDNETESGEEIVKRLLEEL
jgi:hypothetical protein